MRINAFKKASLHLCSNNFGLKHTEYKAVLQLKNNLYALLQYRSIPT